MPTAYFIMGVPRSGTSLLAGILQTLGIHMGDNLIQGTNWNPDGFFVDTDFVLKVDPYISDYLPAIVLQKPVECEASIKTYIQTREAKGIDWGLKEHRMPVLWKFIYPAVTFPIKLLRTNRPFVDSAASWAARVAESPYTWNMWAMKTPALAAVYLQQFKDAVDNINKDPNPKYPLLDVDFYKLLEKPSDNIKAIAKFVDRPTSGAAFDAAVAMVKPEYRRF